MWQPFGLNFCKRVFFLCLSFFSWVYGETPSGNLIESPEKNKEFQKEVQVKPDAEDSAIAERLRRIFEATKSYTNLDIRVQEGLVFLTGVADSDESKAWATELTKNTEAVVAVVNNMTVRKPDIWDITPALNQLKELSGIIVRKSPLIILGVFLLVGLYYFTILSTKIIRWFLFYRFKSPLLRDVLARSMAIPIFLIGLLFILYITGLSRLAITLLGGTGLAGLILGFAFKDIAENLLASILISIQRPFSIGDLIEVDSFLGYVQSVNTRATLLLTQEGNYVQIPNATIYKESITNFTANPQTREDFFVGIGYEDSITYAQSIALSAIKGHDAISHDPAPLVLVNKLDSSTVNLRISYWFDISKLNRFKLRSSIIRRVKDAFDEAGISMPDDAREIIFPAGVPVQMIEGKEKKASQRSPKELKADQAYDPYAKDPEGDLKSDANEIQERAKEGEVPEGGTNLLN